MKNIPYYYARPIADLRQMFYESCELYKDNVAYLSKDEGPDYREIKYSQVLEDVNALGTALIDLGLKDKKIALIGENRYEWSISYFSVICGTGTVVPLDRMLQAYEIENCLKRAEVSAVIYSDKLEEKVEQTIEKIDSVKYLITMGKTSKNNKILSIHDLVKKGKELVNAGNTKFTDTTVDNTALATLLFTSGTTSESKAVMLSHENLAFDIMGGIKLVDFTSEDRFLSILPIHHTYECTCGFLLPFYAGASVAYCEGLRYISSNMKEAKPTIVLLVPLIAESLYSKIWEGIEKQGKTKTVKTMVKITNVIGKQKLKKKLFHAIHENFGGRLRLLVAGAAAFNPEVSKGLRGLGITGIQGYGLTECSPLVAVNRTIDFKDEALGLPLPDSEVKINNPNEEGIGEIIVKGKHVMAGYYKAPDLTEEVLKDGWLYTGDLGLIDRDGFIHMRGRKKNVIITKNGKNIYPEEIEAMLYEIPHIKECMVYSKDDDETVKDTKVVAALFLNKEYCDNLYADSPKTDEELKSIVWDEVKKVNQNLVFEKRVKEITIRDTEFEKTTTMKIKRYLA